MKLQSLLLIDGKNAIYRHQNVHNALTTEEGFPTGALFGCLNSMISIAKNLKDVSVIWVWDGIGPTWRHKFMETLPQVDDSIFEEEKEYIDDLISESFNSMGILPEKKPKKLKARGYKANRSKFIKVTKDDKNKYPETARERGILQIPILKLILEKVGIKNFEVPGLECDDLLAMLVRRVIKLDKDIKVYVHSGDKDYYQLLKYKQVEIITRMHEGKIVRIGYKNVKKKYGVSPRNWAKYRALTGDSSDNIPHLKNVGGVRAKQMLDDGLDPSIQEWKTIPSEVQEKYARYFGNYPERMWQALNGNYKLCKLVYHPDDVLLDEEVQKKLIPIFKQLKSINDFCRKEDCKNEGNFRKVNFLLSRYELSSIIARHADLWAII